MPNLNIVTSWINTIWSEFRKNPSYGYYKILITINLIFDI